MAAYVIVDLEVTDPAGYEEYRRALGPTLERYGARTVIRSPNVEVLEGEWRPHQVVVLEFDSVDGARQWWESEEYAAIKSLRLKSSRASIILVPGS